MESIKTAQDIVYDCLNQFPATRNSDDFLYLQVCKKTCWQYGLDFYKLSAVEMLTRRKELHLPSYETVRRARQKMQEKYKEFAPVPDVEAARMINEEKFREYART